MPKPPLKTPIQVVRDDVTALQTEVRELREYIASLERFVMNPPNPPPPPKPEPVSGWFWTWIKIQDKEKDAYQDQA